MGLPRLGRSRAGPEAFWPLGLVAGLANVRCLLATGQAAPSPLSCTYSIGGGLQPGEEIAAVRWAWRVVRTLYQAKLVMD